MRPSRGRPQVMRPSRGRPFIYTTSKDPKSNCATANTPLSKKRKWSPGSNNTLADSRGTTSTSFGNSDNISGKSVKIAKTDHNLSFDDSDLDLDELGTAALEQFELTQLCSNDHKQPPAATSIGATSSGAHTNKPNPILHKGKGQRLSSVYQPNRTESACHSDNQSSDRPIHSVTVPSIKAVHPYDQYVQTTSPPGPSSAGEKKAIDSLQEEIYMKDGEVKVLRSEKERLLDELKKREEQMQEIQTKLVSERKAVETQLSKEKDSLNVRLEFQTQELLALREKYLLLEQKKNSSAATQLIPTARPISTVIASKNSQQIGKRKSVSSDFLSTECFIPLSQVSEAAITPVHIKEKRDQSDVKTIKVTKQFRSQPSCSSPIVTSGSGTDSASGKRAPPKSISDTAPSLAGSASVTGRPNVTTGTAATSILNVPSQGLDDAQLLMLLVRRDLLRPPVFKALDGLDSIESSVVVTERDSQQSLEDDTPQSTTDDNEGRLTGLLSLLRIQPKALPSHLQLSNAVSTPRPVLASKAAEAQLQYPPVSSPIGTPARNKKLKLSKPHTLARTDISKPRLDNVQAVTKSLSASNTPLHISADKKTSVLLCSVDKSGLEKSIGALLQSADISSITRCESTWSTGLSSPSGLYSKDSIIDLFQQIAAIVIQYHAEQSHKAKGANININLSEFGDTMDSSSSQSPKSSLASCSSFSSKTSSDIFVPLRCDQNIASQALDSLETLVSYSRSVREKILSQTPDFMMVSRPGSSLDIYSSLSDSIGVSSDTEKYNIACRLEQGSDLAEVSRKLSFQREDEGKKPASSLNSPAVQSLDQNNSSQLFVHEMEWKGRLLSNLFHPLVNMSNKVWIDKEHAPQQRRLGEESFTMPSSDRASTGVGCGGLFQALLEIPAPPWRESCSNIATCLNILATLAEDCPTDQLDRFSPLLTEDCIGLCLDRDDLVIPLSTLKLLRHLVKSPAIVSFLCYNTEYCIPHSCYFYLLTPPSGSSKQAANELRLQIVRFISNVLVAENGPSVLLISSCRCTHELLKNLVLLLNNIIDNVYDTSQWNHQELKLILEVISLMHKISIHDGHFDSHLLECENTYLFVLTTLSWLLKTHSTSLEEVALVTDLLEYCEDLEDSEEHEKME